MSSNSDVLVSANIPYDRMNPHNPTAQISAVSQSYVKEGHLQMPKSIPVSENTLPSASNVCTKVPANAYDLHHKDTVTVQPSSSQLLPPSVPRSPSPLERPSYLCGSSSDSSSSEEESALISGAKPPSTQHIQQLMEELFSSDSTSSDCEENMETVLSAVLRDPLERSMEGIEDLATAILRTGKLSLQGEAGDMSKLQPILLGLQASERETAQLLPQMMQVPFFEQVDTDDRSWIWSPNGHGLVPEDFLACGHIRLGLPIDTAIYHLLHRHCAKGARQAEAIIQLSQTVEYVKNLGNNLLPALICSTTVLTSPSPPLHEKFTANFENFLAEKDECLPSTFNGHTCATRQGSHDSGVFGVHNDMNHLHPQHNMSYERNGLQRTLRDQSDSSLLSSSNKTQSSSHISRRSSASLSSPLSSTSSLPMVHSASVDTGGDKIRTITEGEEINNGGGSSVAKQSRESFSSSQRKRKKTLFHHPSFSGSEISDDGNSSLSRMSSTGQISFDRNQWNVTVMDNNMIVGMFGNTTYPLLTWNPKLKLHFEISSPAGVPGVVVAIDPATPILNIRLHNSTANRIAFSIRAYRQTCVHTSHVIYPLHGLHVLESAQCWEENADIHQDSPEKNEYIVVELFFATLETNKPSWNVLRKYAVMKTNKRRRRPSRGTSVFQMPGATEKKHDNLRQVIAHGLQCVVKNKHSLAEIIFTQALYLPDFQRIELKAFVYICLAVVAYRRQKAGEIESLTHAMNLVNSVDKLIEACEAPRTIRMPRTVLLVKQLKKELNFSDIVKNMRKKDRLKHHKLVSHYQTEGSTTLMCEEGGFLSHSLSTTLLVPRGALKSEMEVTLSGHDHKQLEAMLVSTGWDKTVQIMCAVNVKCEISAGRFKQPVQIQATIPTSELRKKSLNSPSSNFSLSSTLLLLHSNYLRKWEDITRDSMSSVTILENGVVAISTDRVGWLAVATVDIDPARIASMAMQALSIPPMTLEVRVYGQHFPDDVMQITIMTSPTKEQTGDEPGQGVQGSRRMSENQNKGIIDHTQISFPYLIEAYPGEELRCRLKGSFQPDFNSGETDLDFHFKATQSHDSLSGKFIRLTTPLGTSRGGKLIISRHLTERWEDIADVSIHLSTTSSSALRRGSRQSRSSESQK